MKFELEKFHRFVTDDELIHDLTAVEAKLKLLKKNLTFRSYKELGKFSTSTFTERFGTWNEALKKAGFEPTQEKNISLQALFDNLKIVWISKGKQPVFRDMNTPPSQYSASVYTDRLGGWRNALEEFVKSVNNEQEELEKYEVQVKKHILTKRTKRDPSLTLRFFVLKRDNFRCVACGCSPATHPEVTLEVDHIIPWSKGGETIEENLQTLCNNCNRGKSDHL
jgi:5-methylcytosine-specific restriction endonuclease McrA